MLRAATRNGPSDQGNGRPGITGDGNIVAFASFASNLAPGDGNGAGSDVFVRDLRSSTTSLVSAASEGGAGASISDDGRFVVFQTDADLGVRPRDRHDRAGECAVRSPANGISGDASVSADGRYATFHTSADDLVSGDGNGGFDVYVRSVSMPTVASVRPNEVRAGHTERLTVTGSGFLPGARASISLVPPPGVRVTSLKVRSETRLELRVSVDEHAPLGPRNLFVWVPGTGPGAAATTFALCHDCLAVTSGAPRAAVTTTAG